jgi:uncharacterized membrane protein (UPF0127 family)
MKYLLLLGIAALVAGCDQSAAPPSVASSVKPPKVESARPSTDVQDPAVTPAPPAAPVADPNRVYQLADLDVKDVKTPRGTVKAWIMDTEGKRTEGMMFLQPKEVKENEGMLFAFPADKEIANSFWMKDTPIALDIAFVAADGKVINVGKGKPYSEDQVRPLGSYRYVLELKQGQAEKLGVKAGTKITIPTGIEASA